MTCPNCGNPNDANYKFCIKCGSALDIINIPNNNQAVNIEPNTLANANPQPTNNNGGNNEANSIIQPMNQPTAQPMNQPVQPTNTSANNNEKANFLEFFNIILSVILKPFTSLKDKMNIFNNFKNSAILALIVSLVATITNLIKTVISTVRVTSGGIFSESKAEWVWDNLKEVPFVKIIGKNLLIFLGIIFAIAIVYYIAGLIVKKQPVFSRFLGIAAISVVPMILCALIVSPLLSMIYSQLGIGITIAGAVYTLVILYETINNELLLEGNTKYYVNFICLSILLIAGYYLYMKAFVAPVEDLENMLDMFK